MRASMRTASRSPLINETAVAGQVAWPSLIGGISPTIGLYGATNTSRWSGLDMECLLPELRRVLWTDAPVRPESLSGRPAIRTRPGCPGILPPQDHGRADRRSRSRPDEERPLWPARADGAVGALLRSRGAALLRRDARDVLARWRKRRRTHPARRRGFRLSAEGRSARDPGLPGNARDPGRADFRFGELRSGQRGRPARRDRSIRRRRRRDDARRRLLLDREWRAKPPLRFAAPRAARPGRRGNDRPLARGKPAVRRVGDGVRRAGLRD